MWYGENEIAVRCSFFLILLFVISKVNAQSTHIFISFSIPKASIIQWLEQAEKTDSTVHMRGFVNNSFKETIAQSQGLLGKGNHQGFLIDPKLFEKYKIEKVPAVVFVEDNQSYSVVYGDIGLKAAAEMVIARELSQTAQKTLTYFKEM